LARELIADALPFAEAKNIDLGLEESAPLRLRSSPDGLRLIIRNGLENALKYTQQSGEVTLNLRLDGAHGISEIADNGPGVPPRRRSAYSMSSTACPAQKPVAVDLARDCKGGCTQAEW
jgi:two-component system OmpR family sensor kinase